MIRKIICPFNKDLLDSMDDVEVSLRISSINTIEDIKQYFERSSKKLINIFTHLSENEDLSELDKYEKLPITIILDTFEVASVNIPKRMTILLNSSLEENYEKVKELTKLGYHSGIFIDKRQKIKWLSLRELFKYYVNNSQVYIIEPFGNMINSFGKRTVMEFNSPYYTGLGEYLYVNEEGDLALTLYDLNTGDFISNIKENNDDIENRIDNLKEKNRHLYFVKNHLCATCAGWLMCCGTYADTCEKNECESFFKDVIAYINKSIEKKVKSEEKI